ncbi:hypothetical protein TPB0596_27780 [Tsukamurella pulmonis]|nr:hypothetical protein TPB0596_27780 [Tsukamurella pulmonis]
MDGGVVRVEDRLSVHEKAGAVIGEADAASGPLDDRLTRRRLKAAYVRAHRRLGQVQSLGGAVDAATACDRDHAAQWHDVQDRVSHD